MTARKVDPAVERARDALLKAVLKACDQANYSATTNGDMAALLSAAAEAFTAATAKGRAS